MKKLAGFLVCAAYFLLACAVFCSFAGVGPLSLGGRVLWGSPAAAAEYVSEEGLPTVDPATVRVYTYFGDCRIGHWLNVFDDDNKCKGYVSVVFSAAAPFHQFGFPIIWAGTDENKSSAECRFAIYEFAEDEATTLKGKPVYSEDIWFRGDSGHGMIIPMQKFLPAGKYMMVVSQVTPREEGTSPYIVIPKVSCLYTANYLQFGGISDAPFAFYVDFLKTEGVKDYFTPVSNAAQTVFHLDEPVMITGSHDGNAHCINDEDFAMLSPKIPAGRYLYSLTLLSAPTWSNVNPGSNMSFTVYRWSSNYEKTLKSEPVYGGTVKDHLDCHDLTLEFSDRLEGGCQYLIVLRGIGPKQIGFWNAAYDKSAGWKAYLNGELVSPSTMPLSQYATATTEFIPATTDVPVETETPAPPTPELPSGYVAVPTPTPAPENNKKSGCGSFASAPALSAALAVCGAFVLGMVKKKK